MEVYKPSNFLRFQISFLLPCQLKISPIKSCIIQKKIIIDFFFKSIHPSFLMLITTLILCLHIIVYNLF